MKEVLRNMFNNRSYKKDSELLCFPRVITRKRQFDPDVPLFRVHSYRSSLCTVILQKYMPALMKIICVRIN